MKNNENDKENLVSELYSRKVGLYGLETMKKIMNLIILIYRMRDSGIEITKNIILSGQNRIIIFSPNISKINDLTANFYLTKDDIENQKRRYEAVLNKLALFYPYVEVNIMKGKNILENINHSLENEKSKYDVVVISSFYLQTK